MESNAFVSSHLPSQALVVLSEAASGLHEALRGQRPFPARLPDAKDLHNMSLVGNYSTQFLHNFHPHLLQTLNHGMLAANGAAAAAAAAGAPGSYFASERSPLGKPSVLSNFSLPSAFSPPKYIGISLDQNLFNGSESFRTDSASPTCTSHESMEGSQDYDAVEKGESPRSNNSQDPRDLRHLHNVSKAHTVASSSTASSSSSSSCSTSSAVAAISSAAAVAAAATSSAVVSMATHLAAHQSSPAAHHHAHTHAQHSHPHSHSHHHGHGHVGGAGSAGGAPPPPPPTHAHHMAHAHPHPLSHHAAHHAALASLSMAGLRAVPGGLSLVSGLQAAAAGGAIPEMCPVCGLKLSAEEWHTHFLTELDRLYKLSAGFERANLQATYMFAPPCPAQENAIRTSHNRWETFQRIRNNRQNRLRLKVRKRKYGEMYMMESLYCSSCPICKRKYALETGKLPPEEDNKMQEEIETVDVESCNDDVPDSGSELAGASAGVGGLASNLSASSMHNSNAQPGKLDGILYRTACVMNQKDGHADEQDVSTNVTTASSSSSSVSWSGETTPSTPHTQAHISVKNVSELSSTTHHYYNADSCGVGVNEQSSSNNNNNGSGSNNNGSKELMMDTASCQNDSDEDVIVDDDETVKMSTKSAHSYKRRLDENVGSSRSLENISPSEERPRSEPQVSSTEPGPMDISNSSNNNNNTTTATKYVESMENSLSQLSSMGVPGLTQLDTKVGISSDLKPDDENKCFICKTGIKDLNTDAFLRGRNFYFHQSCANVMSSYRLNKELLSQAQAQREAAANTATPRSLSPSPAQSPQQSVATPAME
ncbi:protein Teyrha-meyrha isoform X1 [Drosophila sulfurigaster albostrigata]|uniref:protein Teyrha-meyrha isoform X1 n=2 Tax=Drosophila sulfurigaster albostrigata TaxID=89887 RepID=UPI002D21DDA7|nr:protein Teyrha-meyrha isoform X1 [Drosophila sulfurigaster albostrigata]XP_062130298.1 protein Teyrha-meyrha isoform X1 [Drosophila sulfurigaster albostrigata]